MNPNTILDSFHTIASVLNYFFLFPSISCALFMIASFPPGTFV